MLVHLLDGFFGDLSCGPLVAEKRSGAVCHGRRYAAHRQHGGHAAYGVCASTKSKQEYAIAGLPHLQNCGVAVDNV